MNHKVRKSNRNKPPKSQQLGFACKGFSKPDSRFGGSLTDSSNPKTKRPLDSKKPIHLIFKANRSVLRLPKTFSRVESLLEQKAKKYGVKIYKKANVGNHIHLVVRMTNRKLWNGFIRDFTSRLAHELRSLGIVAKKQKLWKHRPFTRIVQGWQKAYKSVLDYIYLNQLEADGRMNRKEIKTLRELNLVWNENSNFDLKSQIYGNIWKTPILPRSPRRLALAQ